MEQIGKIVNINNEEDKSLNQRLDDESPNYFSTKNQSIRLTAIF